MAKAQAVRLVGAESNPPARSAERQELALAIARHAEAEQHLAKIREASARATALQLAASRAEQVAQDKLDEAQATAGAALAASIIAGDKLATSPVEEAEERLAKAEAHLRRANEAARLVRAEIPIASREVDAARRDVEEARRKVIQTDGRDCIARLLQEAQDMQNALIERRIALRYLWHFGFVSEPKAIEFLLQGDHLVATYTSPEAQNYAQLPASKLWRDTVAALATDADAALPT